jgi:uncharacterized protein YciI
MFVIVVNYVKPLEEIDRLLAAHREFLQQGYDAGVFLCSGPRIPRHGGIILAKATSRAELLDRIKQDPFYQAEVAEYQIHEFEPNRSIAGLESFIK